jgi:hypothetical protein
VDIGWAFRNVRLWTLNGPSATRNQYKTSGLGMSRLLLNFGVTGAALLQDYAAAVVATTGFSVRRSREAWSAARRAGSCL